MTTWVDTYSGPQPVTIIGRYEDRHGNMRAKISSYILDDVYAHALVNAETKEDAARMFANPAFVSAAKASLR